MSTVSKYGYYARSAFTLLTRVERPAQTLRIFLGLRGALPAEVRLRGTAWRFKVRNRMDVWILKETCIDRDYLWAVGELGAGWNVLDIGASLGDFSVMAARLCPEGTVCAYEPLRGSYALLRQNIALNGVTNVRTFAAAVASQAGTVSIEPDEREPARSRIVATAPAALNVPAVSLIEALDGLPGGRCDFLKVDCEGGEYDILMHSPSQVFDRIQRISLEYHGGAGHPGGRKLAEHLQRLGYHVRQRPSPVHDCLGFLYAERL